jgi:hypothetical protein
MEPHIGIITRKISPSGLPGTLTEKAAVAEICKRFPADEWRLADTHFIGLEPGPAIDVMFIFVKRDAEPEAEEPED